MNLVFKQIPLRYVTNKSTFAAKVDRPQGFQQHFQAAVSTYEKLTISKHAQMRMYERNIEIAPQTEGENSR